MAGDFKVTGAQDLAKLAARLKAEGRGDLRRELLKGMRTSAKKVVPEIELSAQRLPRGGGLADRVAAQKFPISAALTGSAARVRLVGRGMKELKDIDAGRVRHPVWGNRDRWSQQRVAPGFFTNPIQRRAPRIRRDIQGVMQDVARKVARRF